MNGLVIRVLHPDFVENDDEQRRGFIEGVRDSWDRVMAAQQLERAADEWSMNIREREKAVEVFIPYNRGVRRAETEAAAFMMAASVAVVQLNRNGEGELLPASKPVVAAYSYVIERDVEARAFDERPGPKPKPQPEQEHEQQAQA